MILINYLSFLVADLSSNFLTKSIDVTKVYFKVHLFLKGKRQVLIELLLFSSLVWFLREPKRILVLQEFVWLLFEMISWEMLFPIVLVFLIIP